MKYVYEVCGNCEESYRVDMDEDGFASSTMDSLTCACGDTFCQDCAQRCDGCKTVVCNTCSAMHWDTGDALCLSCAQPMYTGHVEMRRAA